ncbi:MAG: ribonuclease III domain-containing protein [Leptolyngbyaceae cyanobacterium bins.59]|nr:ribonuclease III domain-containing protein [Leptolyngbyaceae cyanobacterium bins.59]
MTPAQIQQLSPMALAYLGDSVYELYVRTQYLFPPKRSHLYHHQVVAQVKAESQAHHLRSLEPYLNHLELEILRRGRNAASGGPRRVNLEIYRQATSLETLIGYLYLTNPQRLAQLLDQLSLGSSLGDPLKESLKETEKETDTQERGSQ